MKRVVHYKTSKKTVINIMASGLTRDEIGQIEELIRSMARKRSHGKRPHCVCWECYLKLMEKGYDGEYYDESDEQIEDDY